MDGYVSISWLSRMVDEHPAGSSPGSVERALDHLLGR